MRQNGTIAAELYWRLHQGEQTPMLKRRLDIGQFAWAFLRLHGCRQVSARAVVKTAPTVPDERTPRSAAQRLHHPPSMPPLIWEKQSLRSGEKEHCPRRKRGPTLPRPQRGGQVIHAGHGHHESGHAMGKLRTLLQPTTIPFRTIRLYMKVGSAAAQTHRRQL